jgi:hypothetical protein
MTDLIVPVSQFEGLEHHLTTAFSHLDLEVVSSPPTCSFGCALGCLRDEYSYLILARESPRNFPRIARVYREADYMQLIFDEGKIAQDVQNSVQEYLRNK